MIFLQLALFLCSALFADPHCLVFVHIGNHLPRHLKDSVTQARLFNPHSDIFLIGTSSALHAFENDCGAIPIPIESLTPSPQHQLFAKKATSEAFWRYTLERFLVLDDFIQQYALDNVFHIENDVMLYFDLSQKLATFQSCYHNQMATVFDCDERSVPSFVYLANPAVSKLLAEFIAERTEQNTTDMYLLSLFKDTYYKKRADHLPILIPSYSNDYPLTNIFKNTAKAAAPFSAYLDQLNLIFDAAALGQFLGGIDPILGASKPGFLGEASVFLPMFFQFKWEKDREQRWIPYMSYRGETYPIANLHIHCKDLARFSSLNASPPPLPTESFSSLPFHHIQRIRPFGSFFSQELSSLTIADWLNPTASDYYLIDQFLKKKVKALVETPLKDRPFPNDLLNIDFYGWITYRMNRGCLAKDPITEPSFQIEYLNNDPTNKEKCVICYASFPNGSPVRDYPEAIQHLRASLKKFHFDGHFIYRIGGWPNVKKGRLKFADVPFGFKPFFFEEVRDLGYKSILWLDACCIPVKSLDPLFDHIKEKGVCFYSYDSRLKWSEFNQGYSYLMPYLNLSSAGYYEDISSQIVGLHIPNPQANQLLNAWIQAAEKKIPFLMSDEPPFKFLVSRLGLNHCKMPSDYYVETPCNTGNFAYWEANPNAIIYHQYDFLDPTYKNLSDMDQ